MELRNKKETSRFNAEAAWTFAYITNIFIDVINLTGCFIHYKKRTRSVQTKYSYKEQMGKLGFEILVHEICEIIGCTVYKCIPLIDFVLTPK